MLLAQIQSDSSNANPAVAIGIVVGFFIGILIFLIPFIFYLLALQKALGRCAPENRAMAPGMVWLVFIPLFGLVWQFFIVINIAKSLDAEFRARGIQGEPMPGKTLGLAMCIVNCCCIIPVVNLFAGVASLICWILYWVKIAGFSKQIAA